MPTPDFLLRFGLGPQAKVLDLKSRVRCRGCRSEGTGCRFGQVGATGRLSRAPYSSAGHDETRSAGVSGRRALDRESYDKKADASEATTCQTAAQTASDRSNTMVNDAPSDQ
jgi:hypothetical protein